MVLAIDLTNARQRVGQVLFGGNGFDSPSTVRITVDPLGAEDDTFNTTTGAWTRVGQTTFYEGPASFRPGPLERARLEDDEARTEWFLSLPLTAHDPPGGAFVEILTCLADPALVGRRFRVIRTISSSLGVVRRCSMHEYTTIGRERP